MALSRSLDATGPINQETGQALTSAMKQATSRIGPRGGVKMADRFCACQSDDAHRCWALRYHGHTSVSELTVSHEGGPCECSCHEDHERDRDEALDSIGWFG